MKKSISKFSRLFYEHKEENKEEACKCYEYIAMESEYLYKLMTNAAGIKNLKELEDFNQAHPGWTLDDFEQFALFDTEYDVKDYYIDTTNGVVTIDAIYNDYNDTDVKFNAAVAFSETIGDIPNNLYVEFYGPYENPNFKSFVHFVEARCLCFSRLIKSWLDDPNFKFNTNKKDNLNKEDKYYYNYLTYNNYDFVNNSPKFKLLKQWGRVINNFSVEWYYNGDTNIKMNIKIDPYIIAEKFCTSLKELLSQYHFTTFLESDHLISILGINPVDMLNIAYILNEAWPHYVKYDENADLINEGYKCYMSHGGK